MSLNDVHCHLFSSRFLELLAADLPGTPDSKRAPAVSHRLGWDDPGCAMELGERWVGELDAHGVARAALIASIPGDEGSVAEVVRAHPARLVGFFMFNPAAGDVSARLVRHLGEQRLKGICLFPAMHRYRLDDERVVEVFEAAAAHGATVFAHCGMLTIGARKKLGLPSAFDLRLGDPLALAVTASRFPTVPVIVPHFGAGYFREALMAASQCPTLHLDTSSSNGWISLYPGLALKDVLERALAVAGPSRLVFGTDSSFFPRGWHRRVYDAQAAALGALGVTEADRALIFGGNFDRLFPA